MRFEGEDQMERSWRALRAINFCYVPKQDRILVTVNPGTPETWSCWFTRRLALALLTRARIFLVGTSQLLERVPANIREDVFSFEREAALASTAHAVASTPLSVLQTAAMVAELADHVNVSRQKGSLRLELRDQNKAGAAGLIDRPMFLRILEMLEAEANKGQWRENGQVDLSGSQLGMPKPLRH